MDKCCDVIVFPLDRRIGKIRDVAIKLGTKTTDSDWEVYFNQVSISLIASMRELGAPDREIRRQLRAFDIALLEESRRLRRNDTRGGRTA